MSIEFLTKVNEDGTIFLPEEYRHLQSQLVKIQLTEPGKEKLYYRKAADNIVPAELMKKYHKLSDKRLRGELTKAESLELQQVEQEIEKIEENHLVLQLFDQQEERRHQQMMESLEDIGNKLKTLIESL